MTFTSMKILHESKEKFYLISLNITELHMMSDAVLLYIINIQMH